MVDVIGSARTIVIIRTLCNVSVLGELPSIKRSPSPKYGQDHIKKIKKISGFASRTK
ncbi:hypothetical protein GQ600_7059 [Phytophthora cactorum]|nr:hypothetical protein GQ600_7059 [Phytophthora cactorum]